MTAGLSPVQDGRVGTRPCARKMSLAARSGDKLAQSLQVGRYPLDRALQGLLLMGTEAGENLATHWGRRWYIQAGGQALDLCQIPRRQRVATVTDLFGRVNAAPEGIG